MKHNKLIIILSLLAIFVLSLFLRLYHLDQNVPSLYADEVSGSYLSENLLNTPIHNASDLFNTVLLGATRSSWIFGLTPFGTRILSAFYGSLISIAIFLLVVSVSKVVSPRTNKITAILAGFLSAVIPWSFMISRIGYAQISIIVLLVCLHVLLFIKADNVKSYLASLIPLALGVILYPSLVILFPVAFIAVFYYLTKTLNRKLRTIWWSIFVVLVIALGVIGITKYHIFDPNYRGLEIALWRDVNVTADSNYYRGLSRLSTPTIFSFGRDTELLGNKLIFNFPISAINIFTRNYLSFFTPDFLFLKGDNVLRHSTGMVGEFFPFLLPFMLYGAFVFFTKADKKLKSIFLVWILISPLPAAITKDGATYLLRAITLMPFLTYFCALGVISSFGFFKNIFLKIGYGCLIAVVGLYSIYSFLFGYFHVYPALSAPHWEYGFKELSDFQATHPGKFLTIWDDKYPVWYFCFWQKLPNTVCDQNVINTKTRESINNTRIDLPIDNLLFSLPETESDLDEIVAKYKPTYVVIPIKYSTNFPNFKKNAILTKTIEYPDQTTAFTIYYLL